MERVRSTSAVSAALSALLCAAALAAGPEVAPPAGLPPVPVPPDNPLTPEKVALGERLFYEPGFSIDPRVSCAGCHLPENFFVDRTPLSKGILGVDGSRNAGTIVNAAYLDPLMADGRARSLEDQVQYPVGNPVEMNTTPARVVAYLAAQPAYRPLFARAFGDEAVTWKRVTQAIASFERTIVAGDSPFDRHQAGTAPLPEAAQRGFKLFGGKAGCSRCHEYGPERPFFTDSRFHNTGVAWYPANPDPAFRLTPDIGRYWITREPQHLGAFRTPSLRNVARTAPYMHDGSLATLRDVVDFYARGPRRNPYLDARMGPLDLAEDERRDLVAFLESLTGTLRYRRPAGAPAAAAPASP